MGMFHERFVWCLSTLNISWTIYTYDTIQLTEATIIFRPSKRSDIDQEQDDITWKQPK